jgi:hypothetical protein
MSDSDDEQPLVKRPRPLPGRRAKSIQWDQFESFDVDSISGGSARHKKFITFSRKFNTMLKRDVKADIRI